MHLHTGLSGKVPRYAVERARYTSFLAAGRRHGADSRARETYCRIANFASRLNRSGVQMPQEGWFRRKSLIGHNTVTAQANPVPEGVATKCARCSQILFTKDFEKNLKVCTHCGFHHKLTAEERISYTVEAGSFSPLYDGLRSLDPLHFPDYAAKIKKGSEATGLLDGFRIGTAIIERVPVMLGVTDFLFIGGTMGSVAGEKVVRAMEESIRRRLPLVIFVVSGGARMQEGLVSLMQMATTSAAAARLSAERLPFLIILSDPTTGGVLASYATLGDILIAEPGAMIGLAGARVSAQASGGKAPDDYQTAEWQLKHGHIDQIVPRKDLPKSISTLLRLLGSDRLPDIPSEEETPALTGGQNG